MSLRLLEIRIPTDRADAVSAALEDAPVLDAWTSPDLGGAVLHRLLVRPEAVEAITDAVTGAVGDAPDTRIVILDVEATLPRPEEPANDAEEAGPAPAEAEAGEANGGRSGRVSRDELLQEMESASELSAVYLATAALSTVVAAIGLLRNDVAVIIGAMVIAPLLGPNVALSLAATLGDPGLARRALRAAGAGAAVVLGLSMVLGLMLTVDPTTPELAARTRVGLSDVALALAAGSAGVLAFTSGLPTAVIGVMVAVALLPPLVATGLLAGAGLAREALAAATLVATNVTCVNLAGVATFLARRVSPREWWEAERARRTIRVVMAIWAGLLTVLVLLIVFAWNE